MRLSNLLKWGGLGIGLLLSTITYSQTTSPKMLGYQSATHVLHEGTAVGDTFYVYFNGGMTVSGKHQAALDGQCLPGFKYGLVLSPNAFEKDVFVSKGYYPDYIQLSWELKRFQSQVTAFKIFRRELGGGGSFAQVANIAASSTTWKDEFAESGVMYEYKLFADGLFPLEQPFLNILTGVGFRLPSGKVSGRITYEGGGAVQGATLIAETEDNFDGTSLALNGTDAYLAISPPANHAHFKLNSRFTFQAWFKPTSGAPATLFQKGSQYKITHTNGAVTFNANGTSTTVNFTEKVDTFFHVTAVRALDSLRLYVMYDNQTIYKTAVAAPVSTPSNNDEILIGKNNTNGEFYKGLLDEVRIWYRALPEKEIKIRSFMYIAGTEDSLSAYYRMNEGVGNNFYDLSRKGFNFNEKHGFMSANVQWSADIPNRTQLAVKGITDKNGNYLISGVPYTSDGSTYRIVPAFGVHSFEPTERLMFIGPGANVYSDVNFIDVASFQVTGKVFYKNTRFPVSTVQIKIDGLLALNSDGAPISTDANGEFRIDVPIGKHQLQLVKNGHVFRGDGFFPDSISTYDFQQPLTIQQNFIDTTLIKVVGKVVGGPIQAAKAAGMGKTTNNIGKSKIIMTTQREWDLKENAGDINKTWNNEFYHHTDGLKNYATTAYNISDVKPKEIEIRPDPTTGEYVAYLLPERYVIKSIVAGEISASSYNYTFDNSYHTVLDLTNSYLKKTEKDSVQDFTDVTVNPQTGDTTIGYLFDSLSYNVEKDFILRVNPTVSMTSANPAIARFWEEKVTAKDGTEQTVVSSDAFGAWLTGSPIFLQRGEYKTKIKVFEQYTNVNNSNTVDNVPVIDGTVRIQNNLAIDNKIRNYEINKQGELNYTFKGGLPNTAEGGIGSFQKTMTVKVFTGKNGSIVTDWPTDGSGFKGYLFGGMPTGNNFVSTGPNVVSMILRDPHGSNSYAYYETGVSNSTEVSYDVSNGETLSRDITASFGSKLITFAGVGAGVITETEVIADVSAGLTQSTTWVDNNTSIITTTNTKKWSTSPEIDFVGANGDVFIGNSTNIVYGKNVYIDLLPDTQCDANSKCIDLTGSLSTYNVGVSEGIRISPEFSTGFQYTQNHIEGYLIPQLIDLRNNYYLTKRNTPVGASTEYVCVVCSGKTYGKSNDTQTMTRKADKSGINGDSYNINYPTGWPTDVEYVDSVAWYNSQIKSWQNVLARNEKEKAEATLIQNYSYDAGVIFESSTTVENSESRTETFDWTISPSVSSEIGVDVIGIGFASTISFTYDHAETKSTTTNETTSATFGYVLNDGDEGDFYSIDIKDAETGTGPVFAVRGGQSKCPHVDAEVSNYFESGKILSEATMRREVPQISVSQSIVNNVPQGKAANFSLQLSNVAETGDPAWYRLSIDESSISGGTLQIDGANIMNGRTFFIDGGKTLNKTLNLRQAVPDSFRFENVRLVLGSLCQYDPADNWVDISDTVEVSAYFQPACSEISISNPADLWLVNTADIQYSGTEISTIPLNVGLNNYNLAHSTFEKIAVQYKSTSSSQWVSDMVFYMNPAQFNTASAPKRLINGAASLNYTIETKALQDRNYDVRLQTQCADGTVNTSEVVTGIKDVKRPKLFGTPQPGDGILSPGDDIMITFDEDIQQGLLTSFNFTVKGVLNGADIAHNSVLFFDGVNDNASVIEGVKLTDKSFTVEFWTKRLRDGANEALFAQGDFEIGFNAANNLYSKFGNQTLTSSATYPNTDEWIHIAVAYDYSSRQASLYVNDQIAVDNKPVTSIFDVVGRMYVGQTMIETNNYNGYIHDLRVWETAKGQGSIISNMNVTQTPDQIGLSGLWPMDDAAGALALDKSRNHHAVLNGATWAVFPRGYARNFTGSDYVTVPAGELVITNEMDMTIEFWMKAGAQANTVIFSNGKGDGTDASPPTKNIWVIGSDANGKLYATNNGTKLTLTSNVFNNEWHHIALVTKRIANTAIYVDGNQEVFSQSSNFGGFSGAQLSLGASQFKNGGSYLYSQNFTGKLDEFRFWKLARTKKLIELDKNAKLKGDEVGLMAYYPFDVYDINLLIQPTLNDQVALSNKVATATGGTADNGDVPNIKDARPVQQVRYNWVVNEDQIIINVTEDAELIEKTVLEITVQDVEDLNENRLASPVTWTAYINKNTVLWDQKQLNFEKKLYEKVTFEVKVLNLGGTEQNYEISNTPGWLSVDEPTGTLAPVSEKTLRFEISESTNIGNYQQSVYLGSDFGFKEKLEITLKVKGDEPNWTVDGSKFEYNMSVIGIINIDGITSTNADDKIAAYVNGELRGVANLQYVQAYDQYEFFLDVFSNETDGETIEFKVWNASQGKVQVDVTPQLAFLKNDVVGIPSNPTTFYVTNNVVINYPMKKGWNWISFNVNSPSLTSSNSLFPELNSKDGDIVKTLGKFDQFGTLTGWIGEISKQGGFDLMHAYKMKLSQADTFTVVGSSIETAAVAIPIKSGWNWVGFPSELNMAINDAFGNVNFENSDFIKGQNGFAIYDEYLGWIGSLKFMQPTKGYMLKTASNHSLTYPNPELLISARKGNIKARTANFSPNWSVVSEDYANSMAFILHTDLCNEAIVEEEDYVGVFIGDECRGLIEASYIENLEKYVFFLTAYSNTNNETLTFKFFDGSSGTTYELNENYSFLSDAIAGDANSPYEATVVTTDLCKVTGLETGLSANVKIYPNPFTSGGVSIHLLNTPDTKVNITISDLSGRTIRTFSTTESTIQWDGLSDDGNEVSQGIYILSVPSNTAIHQVKLVKN